MTRTALRRRALLLGLVLPAAVLAFIASGPLHSGDLDFMLEPALAFSARAWAGGHAPLWDPLMLGGLPHAAQLQLGTFSPPVLLAGLLQLSPSTTVAWLVLFHGLAAALGGTLLGLRWTRSFSGAVALGWLLGLGPIATHLHAHFNHAWALALVPWVLLAADGIARRPDGRAVAALAVAEAGLVLAGSPDVALFALAAAAWIARRRLLPFALGSALGALLSAVGWLPFLELLARSNRAEGLSAFQAGRFPLIPAQLPELLLGPLSASPEAGTLQGAFLPVAFLGLGPLLLLLRGRRALLLSALLGLLVLAALGPGLPLWELLRRAIPLLWPIRFPAKLMLLATWLVAWGAASGVARPTRGVTLPQLALFLLLAVATANTATTASLVMALSPAISLLLAHGWAARRRAPLARRLALLLLGMELGGWHLLTGRAVWAMEPPCIPVALPAQATHLWVHIGDPISLDADGACSFGLSGRNLLAGVPSWMGFVVPRPLAPFDAQLDTPTPEAARTFGASHAVVDDGPLVQRYGGRVVERRGSLVLLELGPGRDGELTQQAIDPLPFTLTWSHPGEASVEVGAGATQLRSRVRSWPGWQARFEGEPLPLTADAEGFLTAPLPGRAGRVVLTYAPVSFQLGLAGSALGLLLLGVALRRRRA